MISVEGLPRYVIFIQSDRHFFNFNTLSKRERHVFQNERELSFLMHDNALK